MEIFNNLFGKIFDILFLPFRAFDPWFALIFVSFLTGLLMLLIFRLTSNQDGILKAKNKIKAHLLELRLYKDSMRQSFKSQGRILAANLKYLGYALKPMLVMFVPVMLILFQLNAWFGARAFEPGESGLLKINLLPSASALPTDIRLESPSGLVVDTPPLRIEEDREIDWRLRAKDPGWHELVVRWAGESIVLPVAVGRKSLARIPTVKPGSSALDQLSNPGIKPLPKNALIRSIEVGYPSRRFAFFGLRIHWLVAFFILSIVFGFAFKGVFKVEV
jgi:uncharacterized membrane protein (DUF106 family)